MVGRHNRVEWNGADPRRDFRDERLGEEDVEVAVPFALLRLPIGPLLRTCLK